MRRGKKKDKLAGSLDKSGKLVSISFADSPTDKPRKLNVNADTTVNDVVELLLMSTPVANDCKYGVALASDQSIVFSGSSNIAKIPEDTFVFRKVSIPARVYIPHLGTTETFVIDPSLSIADVILFIEHSGFHGSEYGPLTRPPTGNATPNHELVLVTSEAAIADISNWCTSGNQGVHMEFKRSLGSYRVKPHDMMVLKSATAKNQVWKDMTKTEIPLIISSDEFHLTKAFKYPGTVTFDEVVQKFLAKANMTVSKWFYGLYLDVAGEKQYLEPHWSIGSFPLPVPARLTCKENPRAKVPWFGTDPSRLPKAVDPDNGLEVPDILLLLKDMLCIVNGMEAEGIFRRAGLESEMKRIKEQLQQGEKVSCKNPHTIGTMIKRWFKEVPVRLLAPLDKSGDPVQLARNLHLCMGKEEYILFRWLLDLLTRVAELQDANKMTPSNLAIVWGPGLVGSVEDSAFTPEGFGSIAQNGFDDTKFGIAIMEAAITTALKKRRSSRGEDIEAELALNAAAPAPTAGPAFSTPQSRKSPNVLQTASLTHDMHASELLSGIAEVKLRSPSDGKVGRRRAASTSIAQGRNIVRPPRNRSKSPRPRDGARSHPTAEQQQQQQRPPALPPTLPPIPTQRPPQGPPSPHRQHSPNQSSPRGQRQGSPVGALSPRSQLSPRGQLSPRAVSPGRPSPRRQNPNAPLPLQQGRRPPAAQGRALPQTPGDQHLPRRSLSGSATRSSMIQGRPMPDPSAFQVSGQQPPPLMPRLNAPPQLPGQRQPRPPPAELPPPRGPPPLARRSPRAQQQQLLQQQLPQQQQLPPQQPQQQPLQQQSRGRVSNAQSERGKRKEGRNQNFDTIRVAYKTGGGRQSRRSTPNLPPPSSFRKMAAEKEAADRAAAEREAVEACKRAAAAALPPPLPALPSPAAYKSAGSSSPATRSCESLRAAHIQKPPG